MKHRTLSSQLMLLAFALAVTGGCKCGQAVSKRLPQLQLDAERVDYGSVLLNQVHTKTFKVRNLGTGALHISALSVSAPFAVKEAAPLEVDSAGEVALTLTFSPTVAGQKEQAQLTITSDDPTSPTATVGLFGTGVQAVATITPSPVVFGDVYVGTTKTVTVTVKNTGTSELKIQRAELDALTPAAPVFTGDLSPLAVNLVPGASASTDITYAPRSLEDQVKGGLTLVLDATQGGEQKVAFQGAAMRAIPQLCFLLDGALPTCTDADATAGMGTSINLVFPPTCDNRLYPPGSPSACTGEAGANIGVRKAKVWVKNAGNLPVSYVLQFTSTTNANPCGLAVAPPPDFSFSNAPTTDGGTPLQWTEPKTQLPLSVSAAPPWESNPITVTYRASSRCASGAADDTADLARVTLTRQGDSYPPQALFIAITGTSKLAKPVPSSLTLQGTVPLTSDFYGVLNVGSAAFRVNQVTLQEKVPEADGGVRHVDCGTAVQDDGGLACPHFSWTVDPNVSAPLLVPAPPVAGGQAKVKLGILTFDKNPDAGFQLNKQYKLNARLTTDDPYIPVINADVTSKAL